MRSLRPCSDSSATPSFPSWSGLPFPSPGDLSDPGIEPRSPALRADTLTSEPRGKPIYILKQQQSISEALTFAEEKLVVWPGEGLSLTSGRQRVRPWGTRPPESAGGSDRGLPVSGGGEPEDGRCLWVGLSFFITFSLSSGLLTPPFPGEGVQNLVCS